VQTCIRGGRRPQGMVLIPSIPFTVALVTLTAKFGSEVLPCGTDSVSEDCTAMVRSSVIPWPVAATLTVNGVPYAQGTDHATSSLILPAQAAGVTAASTRSRVLASTPLQPQDLVVGQSS
jgi:hypothetical protein